jgi:hypothetical protein
VCVCVCAGIVGGGPGAVVAQQNARYILSQFKKAKNAHPTVSSCQYLASKWQQAKELTSGPWVLDSAADLSDLTTLLNLLQWLSWSVCRRATDAIAAAVGTGLSQFDAWNACMETVMDASRIHTFLLIYSSFAGYIHHSAERDTSPEIIATAKRLARLFAMERLVQELSFVLEFGMITAAQAGWIRKEFVDLCAAVRVEAVGYVCKESSSFNNCALIGGMCRLVDGIGIADFQLQSALGNYSGDMYNCMALLL